MVDAKWKLITPDAVINLGAVSRYLYTMKPRVIQLLFEIALCLALMAAPPFLPDILLFSMYCVFAKNSQNKIAEMDVALLDV